MSAPLMAMDAERSTHVLVPEYVAEELRRLAGSTRVSQAQYLREAVSDLLEKHEPSPQPVPRLPWHHQDPPPLVSVVFRISDSAHRRLSRLALVSRVRRSEFLREAIWDVLRKYEPTMRKAASR